MNDVGHEHDISLLPPTRYYEARLPSLLKGDLGSKEMKDFYQYYCEIEQAPAAKYVYIPTCDDFSFTCIMMLLY